MHNLILIRGSESLIDDKKVSHYVSTFQFPNRTVLLNLQCNTLDQSLHSSAVSIHIEDTKTERFENQDFFVVESF